MESTEREQLIVNTARLWRSVRRALEEAEPSPWVRLSLSRGQLRILFLLFTTRQMSPGAVAVALGVPKANVTEIIERLVRQRLVRREQNLQDRRSHTLCLTEKGRSEVERLQAWSTSRIERVLKRIPEKELEVLAHGLDVMLTAAQQTTEVPVERHVLPRGVAAIEKSRRV